MKNLKTTIAILILSCMAFSCTKKDDAIPAPKVFLEESFYEKFLSDTGLNENSKDADIVTAYEFGLQFKPLAKGSINAFNVQLSKKDPSLRVTLWDVAAKKPITTEFVNVTVANFLVSKKITPIPLEKGKEYIISINTSNARLRERSDNARIKYPIQVGNIEITKYAEVSGSSLQFPVAGSSYYIAGDCSFIFQQTE
jgi:hypothetical protein